MDTPVFRPGIHAPRPRMPIFGAMGSRRTHKNRNQRLREAGTATAQRARLHSPIGLDLGAHTPEGTDTTVRLHRD
ncbi:xanthine/CO dehydrogenase XdhC/CoxF family maturation factor [Streptomyces canus]|uniref:XdhC family protein n=1 Tax=Streptomyces canus TaxID=58343 RepID=UPI0027888C13|nr:xanthine/CO dehydrogenase XdhC/CoxF family maturation factor [Streptomyces canus]